MSTGFDLTYFVEAPILNAFDLFLEEILPNSNCAQVELNSDTTQAPSLAKSPPLDISNSNSLVRLSVQCPPSPPQRWQARKRMSPSKFCFSQFFLLTMLRKKPKTDHPEVVIVEDHTKNLPFDDAFLVILLTVLAAAVRLYKIDFPTSVVFDEVHFGGFASK